LGQRLVLVQVAADVVGGVVGQRPANCPSARRLGLLRLVCRFIPHYPP
jgi:hypothetical protein